VLCRRCGSEIDWYKSANIGTVGRKRTVGDHPRVGPVGAFHDAIEAERETARESEREIELEREKKKRESRSWGKNNYFT